MEIWIIFFCFRRSVGVVLVAPSDTTKGCIIKLARCHTFEWLFPLICNSMRIFIDGHGYRLRIHSYLSGACRKRVLCFSVASTSPLCFDGFRIMCFVASQTYWKRSLSPDQSRMGDGDSHYRQMKMRFNTNRNVIGNLFVVVVALATTTNELH